MSSQLQQNTSSIEEIFREWMKTEETNRWVIACLADGEKKPQFYAIDQTSGGYSYWTDNFESAEKFRSESAAEDRLEGESEAARSNYSDGSSSPNRFLHSAMKLNNAKKIGSAQFFVVSVTLGKLCSTKLMTDRIWQLTDGTDWRDLYYLQGEKNGQRGIEDVRIICRLIKENDFTGAMKHTKFAWPEISKNYTDIANWLIVAGLAP